MKGFNFGFGFSKSPASATPWFDAAGYTVTDVADAQSFGPALIADFGQDRYAITTQSAASIPTASRGDLAVKASCTFADIYALTRSATKTYVDASGVVQTAAINDPAFCYLNGFRELSAEEAATNLLTYSKPTTGQWTAFDATADFNDTTGPTGASDACKVTSGSTSASHRIQSSSVSIVSGTRYSFSAFVKAGTVSRMQIAPNPFAFASNVYVNFSLSGSGAVLANGAGVLASWIKPLGNGWFRVSVTATANATDGGNALYACFINSDTATRQPVYAGNASDMFYIDDAQVEGTAASVGGGASSYIPTAGSTVTRARDVVTYSAKAEAILVRLQQTSLFRGHAFNPTNGDKFLFSNGTTKFRDAIFTKSASQVNTYSGGSDGTGVAGSGNITTGFGIALAKNLSTLIRRICFNGGTVGGTVDGSSSPVSNYRLGSSPDPSEGLHTYLAEHVVWPFRITDTDLQAKAVPYV